jgi:hypothetical protein
MLGHGCVVGAVLGDILGLVTGHGFGLGMFWFVDFECWDMGLRMVGWLNVALNGGDVW